MSIGQYLRRIRKQRGYSIRKVVIRSGGMLDKTTISRIERGERNVSVRALYAFSRIYEVPAEELLAHLVKKSVEPWHVPFDVNDEERRVVEQYRALDRKRQNLVRDMVTCIAQSKPGKEDNLGSPARRIYSPVDPTTVHRPSVSQTKPEYKT